MPLDIWRLDILALSTFVPSGDLIHYFPLHEQRGLGM